MITVESEDSPVGKFSHLSANAEAEALSVARCRAQRVGSLSSPPFPLPLPAQSTPAPHGPPQGQPYPHGPQTVLLPPCPHPHGSDQRHTGHPSGQTCGPGCSNSRGVAQQAPTSLDLAHAFGAHPSRRWEPPVSHRLRVLQPRHRAACVTGNHLVKPILGEWGGLPWWWEGGQDSPC